MRLPSTRTRALAGAAIAILAALAILEAGLGPGGSGAPAPPGGEWGDAPRAAPAPAGRAGLGAALEAAPQTEAALAPTTPRHALELELREGTFPIVWVLPGAEVEIHDRPGGEVIEEAGEETEFGSPTVWSVVRVARRWAGISTHLTANDSLGWVRLDSRRLGAGVNDQLIVVDLARRSAELRVGDETVRSFTVTIGAPGSETPRGRFAVTDTIRGGLSPVYGCCAVVISATQPDVPSGWLGGNRIAIHGNGAGAPLGEALSHGCLRADDADVDLLVGEVGLGTPVIVRG